MHLYRCNFCSSARYTKASWFTGGTKSSQESEDVRDTEASKEAEGTSVRLLNCYRIAEKFSTSKSGSDPKVVILEKLQT